MAKNKTQPKHSDKEKLQLVTAISDLYADGNTIQSCCEAVGISFRSFYNWTKSDSKLAKIYNDARDSQAVFFKEKLRPKSYISLEKLVEGYEYEEVKTTGINALDENGNEVFIVKGIEKIKKRVQPNASAVIYSIQSTSSFSPDFVQKNKLDITSNGNTIPGVVVLPQSEIDNLENENPIDSLLENAEE